MANKKLILKRFLISILLVSISASIGIVSGVKLSSMFNNNQSNINDDSQLDELVQILNTNWYSEIYYGPDYDSDLLINQFIGALSTSDETILDPYTYLIKKESSTEVDDSGKMGIALRKYYSYPVITDVATDGAAFGILQKGDIVLETGKIVDGNLQIYKITDSKYNFSTLFSEASGKPGDEAYIKVARFVNNKLEYFTYNITLKEAPITTYAEKIDVNIDDTLMVKFDNFTDSTTANNTANDLEAILSKDDSKNLIIDLRDNGGGALASAVNVADLFLPKDKLVTILQYKDGTLDSCYTKNNEYYDYENIIILQNSNTASASEIFISAMLHYFPEKVSLIGSESYGKGIAQLKRTVLDGKYTLQYTCAKWLRPDSSWIGMKGSYYDSDEYELGFDPSENGQVDKDIKLQYMQGYSSGIDFKEDSNFIAYKEDYVASSNAYFFKVFNELYGTDCRTDYYFDNHCKEAIKQYQERKNISDCSGLMNLETYLHFIKDFYDSEVYYQNSFIEATKLFLD